jgi:hypothetical protein
MNLADTTILTAIEHEKLRALWFRDRATWDAWFAFLRVIFGLPVGKTNCRVLGSLEVDGRFARGRKTIPLVSQLVAQIGRNPTPPRRLAIERIIRIKAQLAELDAKLVVKGRWSDSDTRAYSDK